MPDSASSPEAALRRLPLHEAHAAQGAKWAPFAGYRMPLHYATRPLEEHHLVRNSAGVFDITHMGQLEVRGADATALLRRALTNDPTPMHDGQALYSPLCRADGGVLDDLIVYRLSATLWRIIVNAARRQVDLRWFKSLAENMAAEVRDLSAGLCLLAVQGPQSLAALAPACEHPLAELGYYTFMQTKMFGCTVFLARTGYTGEPGCEISVPASQAQAVWDGLTGELGLPPIGLAARDSLRLEAAMPLYGHELREAWHPLECGLGWAVKLTQAEDCMGGAALLAHKAAKTHDRLVGLEVQGRGIAREGATLFLQGEAVGEVTSGTFSPTLQKAIALAKVRPQAAKRGLLLQARVRQHLLELKVARRPFYSNPATRM